MSRNMRSPTAHIQCTKDTFLTHSPETTASSRPCLASGSVDAEEQSSVPVAVAPRSWLCFLGRWSTGRPCRVMSLVAGTKTGCATAPAMLVLVLLHPCLYALPYNPAMPLHFAGGGLVCLSPRGDPIISRAHYRTTPRQRLFFRF